MNFPESDWKVLSRLKPVALDRLCQRILTGAQALSAKAAEGEHHHTYLALYRYIQEQDQLVADCFNDWRRSMAMIRLMQWRKNHLLTDEEFAGFSPETRKAVDSWVFGNE